MRGRVLGAGSWYADDLDQYEILRERLSWRTYSARYQNGWVVRSKNGRSR